MSCKICNRSGCTESFHSIREQEEYEAREYLKDEIEEYEEQITKLKEENKQLKEKLQAIACLECEKNLLECEC